MKVNEARRIQAMVLKMTQTRHQDEADAVKAQLSKMAGRFGMSADKMVQEAEAIMALQKDRPGRGTADGPYPMEPERPAPMRRQRVDYWKLGRDLPEWQKTLALVAIVALAFALIALRAGSDASGPGGEEPGVETQDFS